MPRVAIPEAFHPRLQFRYMFITSKLAGATIYARGASQPSIDNSPVKVDFMSTYIKSKGKTEWQDITLNCYQFEGLTNLELFTYINSHHIDQPTGREQPMTQYKHDVQLLLLNPMGIPTGGWSLKGAFISNASWGNLDYASDEVAECEITLTYDWAYYV